MMKIIVYLTMKFVNTPMLIDTGILITSPGKKNFEDISDMGRKYDMQSHSIKLVPAGEKLVLATGSLEEELDVDDKEDMEFVVPHRHHSAKIYARGPLLKHLLLQTVTESDKHSTHLKIGDSAYSIGYTFEDEELAKVEVGKTFPEELADKIVEYYDTSSVSMSVHLYITSGRTVGSYMKNLGSI
jgi:hypothetical protein